MFLKKIKRFCAGMCVPLILSMIILPKTVLAQTQECTATIPVAVEVSETSVPSDTEFEVVLAAADEQVPMPERVTGTVRASEQFAFGPMTYSVPGDYHYRITQTVGNVPHYIYDKTSYTVTVRVVNHPEGGLAAEVWAVREGGKDKVDRIVFRNGYQAPKPPADPEAPKTADTVNVSVLAALMAVSALAMILIVFRQRREGQRMD